MIECLSGETRLFPIIGDPIKFVKSPRTVTGGLVGRGHNAMCIPMQVPEADLDVVIRGLARTPNVDGVLITMPHKFKAFGYCATSSERARALGVVNVMRRNPDGTWHGDMLDGLAFVKAQVDGGARPNGAKALLIGAGGAGSAIGIALLEAGVRELIVYDTDSDRASKLLGILSSLGRGRAIAGSPDPTGCDMVCNATPMGIAADDPLPVAAHLLRSSMFVGDVIAGHGVTPLLQAAQAGGCKSANGVQMVDAVQEIMLDFLLAKS